MEQVMLDMIPTGAKAVCHVSQYDIGRTIRFNLISGGAAYTLAGTETVKVYIKKPDGTTAERNIANTSSTYVDWVTGEGDCDQAGICECELVITSGTTVIGSKNFTVKIEEDPYNNQGVVTETAGPAVIATFTTNVVDLLQEVKCSINPIQNGTPWIDSNEVNKEPYIKRAVAGTATRIGNHLYDKLVGGTFPFNQLLTKTPDGTTTINGIEYVTIDGITTANGNNNTGITSSLSVAENSRYYKDHVYYLGGCALGGSENTYRLWANSNTAFPLGYRLFDAGNGTIKKARETENLAGAKIQIQVLNGVTVNNLVFKPQLIDLTQMLGSTIADYIYGLEQATAGAGVAFFKALFPNDYYAYNAGELMSVKATAHVMKNASNQVIGNYALDSNLELRGMPKLVNNKLEYDGDEYTSDGNVLRKYKPYTITSSTQIISQTDLTTVTRYTFITDNEESVISGGGVICVGLVKDNSYSGDYPHIYIDNTAQNKGRIYVFLPIGQAIGTINLVYEKATPTTEQATPFTNPQVCDENGTEEYTDSRAVAIPVGHETYQANICEIIGFDELNVQQTGANLWNEVTQVGRWSNTVGQKCEIVADNTRFCNSTPIRILPSTQYTFVVGNYGACILMLCDDGMNILQVVNTAQSNTFTTPATAKYLCFYPYVTGQTYTGGISLNKDTDNTYHSYSGKLIKLEFDDTVYLAEVSYLNGVWKLKLLGAEVELDGSETWYYSATNNRVYTAIPNAKEDSTFISNKLTNAVAVAPFNAYINQPKNIVIYAPPFISSVEEWTAWLTNNTITVVYELATPIEITLDETEQFESLIGVNNVWHDGNGNTEVKYLYNA